VRKFNNYIIAKESFEDMCKAKRFNPCLEITFRDRTCEHTHKLSAGDSDDITVYHEHGETFVLSQNSGLGYIGLEVFKAEEQTGDIFLEEHQVIEVLGGYDLAPCTIIKQLKDYIY